MLVQQLVRQTPADGGFLLAPEHEECWSRLLFVIEQQRRVGLVTGAAEVGKSSLLRAVTAEAASQIEARWHCLDASGLSATEFACQLAEACDAGGGSGSEWQAVEDWLWGAAAAQFRSYWIIDHADQAQDDLAPALRRLIRLFEQTHAPATLLVSAREWGSLSTVRDLADLWCNLPAWDLETTRRFLQRHRPPSETHAWFSADSEQAVFDCTQGVAGRIRRLSELCSLAAQLRETPRIEVDLVLEVWGELVSPLSFESRRNR